MLTLFGKRKLTEEKVAHMFVNGIQAMIDDGFEAVAGLINDSPEFQYPPVIEEDQSGSFALIILSGNLQEMPRYFESGQDKRIAEHILSKFAELYEIDKFQLARLVGETRKFMARKNHPSKNVVNGMAKALFCRFELNKYQDSYFKELNSPNPIFVQRLKEAMDNFMFDWETVRQKYKVVQTI
jgi:hypothetical protein